jgi:hypothetical protein
MQTFLPLPSFSSSARCLDNKRLGKQRVEALQILKALHGDYDKTSAWVNHPATKMWKWYEPALTLYKDLCIIEWVARGFNNSMELTYTHKQSGDYGAGEITPPWFGREEFHASHRSNLLKKDPEYYSQFGWTEPHDLPYIWPPTGPCPPEWHQYNTAVHKEPTTNERP